MNVLFRTIWFCCILMLAASCSRVDTGKLMHDAVECARQGKYAEAAQLTRICLDANSQLVDALLLDSFCRFKEGRSPEEKRLALYNLAKCTRLEPERFDCWFLYGWALVESAHYKDAVEPLLHADSLLAGKSPHRQKLQMLLGRCYLENSLHDRALSILQPLQIREPYRQMPELYHALGVASLQARRPQTALKFFSSGLKIAPQSTLLLQDMAVATELYGGNPADAKRLYIRLLAGLPQEDLERRLAVQKSIQRTARKAGIR